MSVLEPVEPAIEEAVGESPVDDSDDGKVFTNAQWRWLKKNLIRDVERARRLAREGIAGVDEHAWDVEQLVAAIGETRSSVADLQSALIDARTIIDEQARVIASLRARAAVEDLLPLDAPLRAATIRLATAEAPMDPRAWLATIQLPEQNATPATVSTTHEWLQKFRGKGR